VVGKSVAVVDKAEAAGRKWLAVACIRLTAVREVEAEAVLDCLAETILGELLVKRAALGVLAVAEEADERRPARVARRRIVPRDPGTVDERGEFGDGNRKMQRAG